MEPQLWYGSLPRITKTLFTTSICLALLLRFHTAAWSFVGVDWAAVTGRLQLWRLFSNFLVFGSLTASVWQIGLLSVGQSVACSSGGGGGGMLAGLQRAHALRLT